MTYRKKQSAVEEYKEAVAKLDKERERITELQKRDKSIDIESLILSSAKKYNLDELKERALIERRSYSKADKDSMQIR
jgi:hypothetical protein